MQRQMVGLYTSRRKIVLWCDSNCNPDVKKMDAYTMLFKASLKDIHVGDFETSFNHAPPKLKDWARLHSNTVIVGWLWIFYSSETINLH